jgi:hypothetical protein
MRHLHFLIHLLPRLPSRQFLKAGATAIAPLKLGGGTPVTAHHADPLFPSTPFHWDGCSSKIHESTPIGTHPQPAVENQGYPILLGSNNKRERQSAQGG